MSHRTCLAGLILLCLSIGAQAQFEADIGLYSEYIWRGQSQSEEKPAIQGSINYTWESGFYIGAWASNVRFDGVDDVEVDYYGGYNRSLSENWSLEIGYVRYTYLDEFKDSDSDDIYLGLGYGDLTFKVWRGIEIEWTYLDLSYERDLGHDFTTKLHVGHWDVEGEADAVLDWQAAISKSWGSLTLEVGYTETDLNTDFGDARIYASFVKSF